VSRDTLEKHGAVSRETVLEMARGVCRALSAGCGISVSGIAGPAGGTPDKPVDSSGSPWSLITMQRRGDLSGQEIAWQ